MVWDGGEGADGAVHRPTTTFTFRAGLGTPPAVAPQGRIRVYISYAAAGGPVRVHPAGPCEGDCGRGGGQEVGEDACGLGALGSWRGDVVVGLAPGEEVGSGVTWRGRGRACHGA